MDEGLVLETNIQQKENSQRTGEGFANFDIIFTERGI